MDNHREQDPKEGRGGQGVCFSPPTHHSLVPPLPELPDSFLSFPVWFLETCLGYFNSDLRKVLVRKKNALQGNTPLSFLGFLAVRMMPPSPRAEARVLHNQSQGQ